MFSAESSVTLRPATVVWYDQVNLRKVSKHRGKLASTWEGSTLFAVVIKTHNSLVTCVSCSKTNWYPMCSKCLNINWWYIFYSKVQPTELTNYRAISKSEIFRSWSVFPTMVMLCNSPQAVSDLDRGWTVGPKEAHSKLADLKQKGAKEEVRQFLYWCLTFRP